MTLQDVPVRAVHYVGHGTVSPVEVVRSAPRAGEVEIDVAFTGICGTDLHILHGDMDARVARPAVLGHEMSGCIATLGSGVTGWDVGERVTVMPLVACGACAACTAGHGHVCRDLVFLGIDAPGSMAERWTVPEDLLVRVPPTMDLRHAALVEPTAVAVHDVGRARLVPGERTLVVGGGPVGALVALVAAARGGDVRVAEVDSGRRDLLAAAGLHTIDPVGGNVAEVVDDWTSGAGVEVSFEVSGSPGGLASAVDALGVRGRVVVVAIHPRPQPVDLHRIFWRELTVLGARVYDRGDVEQAVGLIAAGTVPVDFLVSRVVPLAEAATAFSALDAGGVMKVLLDCRRPA